MEPGRRTKPAATADVKRVRAHSPARDRSPRWDRIAAAVAVLLGAVVLIVLALDSVTSAGGAQPLRRAHAAAVGSGRPVTLAFGGDVHFEGALQARLAADSRTALAPVTPLLAGSDLSIVNFESALTNGGCPDPQPKQYVFHAPPAALTAFRSAGVTLVGEANNHALD